MGRNCGIKRIDYLEISCVENRIIFDGYFRLRTLLFYLAIKIIFVLLIVMHAY